MRDSDTALGESFERWSTWAFVASGLLWLGDTTLLGLELLDIYAHGLLNGVFMQTALLAAMVGLLGLSPRLADRTPRLALVGAGVSAVGGIGLAATFVWQLGAIALSGVSTPPGATAFPPLAAFALVGVACMWTDVPSRTVGLLLITNLVALLGAVAATGWLQVALAALVGASAVATGYAHHVDVAALDSVEPSAGSMA